MGGEQSTARQPGASAKLPAFPKPVIQTCLSCKPEGKKGPFWTLLITTKGYKAS